MSGTYRVSGVVGSYTSSSQINNTWYATTDAAGNAINTSNYSGIGTAKILAEMKQAATYSSLTGADAGNYNLTTTSLTGNMGKITPKIITGALVSGYSFDKFYDGTMVAYLGNGYNLNGVVAGDKVLLTATKGFYDSSAIGDRTVTFSGFSINDGNYLLSMADSLSGIGKITSNGNTNNNTNGFSDHNYSDALIGVRQYY